MLTYGSRSPIGSECFTYISPARRLTPPSCSTTGEAPAGPHDRDRPDDDPNAAAGGRRAPLSFLPRRRVPQGDRADRPHGRAAARQLAVPGGIRLSDGHDAPGRVVRHLARGGELALAYDADGIPSRGLFALELATVPTLAGAGPWLAPSRRSFLCFGGALCFFSNTIERTRAASLQNQAFQRLSGSGGSYDDDDDDDTLS